MDWIDVKRRFRDWIYSAVFVFGWTSVEFQQTILANNAARWHISICFKFIMINNPSKLSQSLGKIPISYGHFLCFCIPDCQTKKCTEINGIQNVYRSLPCHSPWPWYLSLSHTCSTIIIMQTHIIFLAFKLKSISQRLVVHAQIEWGALRTHREDWHKTQ